MEPYLESALRRAGIKLGVGLAVIGAGIGLRIVTATPAGIEGELAELERFEAEAAAQAEGGAQTAASGERPAREGGDGAQGGGLLDAILPDALESASAPAGGAHDPDRMVRCRLGAGLQFMRAADCATRGGALEELPPPEPETESATGSESGTPSAS